jgi:hypothetical protein
MLRFITAIFLFVAFTAQTFNKALIMLDYYTNTASFAKNCINKARPMLHCNGKCQMMKKLQQEEKKEQQYPESRSGSKNQDIYFNPVFAIRLLQPSTTLQVYSDLLIEKVRDDSPFIFHPPCV